MMMATTFFTRVELGRATAFAQDLADCVHRMEVAVGDVDGTFTSPLKDSVKAWGAYAHQRIHISPMYRSLEHWYESLRLLVVTWEEMPAACIEFLRMAGAFEGDNLTCWPGNLPERLASFRDSYATLSFHRFERLKEVLLEQLRNRADFRGLLFVQQRVMTHVLEHAITSDTDLAGLHPVCLYATSSPATASLRVTKTDTTERLQAFRTGRANLLITTTVSEEGMDVPEANCVVRFDPIQTCGLLRAGARPRKAGRQQLCDSQRARGPLCKGTGGRREAPTVCGTKCAATLLRRVERSEPSRIKKNVNGLPILF